MYFDIIRILYTLFFQNSIQILDNNSERCNKPIKSKKEIQLQCNKKKTKKFINRNEINTINGELACVIVGLYWGYSVICVNISTLCNVCFPQVSRFCSHQIFIL
ncbi:uncharacterized protein ASCRUDRAFT_132232 [Ascoidea rubescens DSM 1968]|uniref:Uncharacterized protein n=1 Tax=Ascoidea rubescens DSM 1968 TaxID=1344418 RepID=A0A1D2VKL1_9ASCO|nr:hypothetical protein ASCRUDRAFT_132232 [Ascoidea rubescens DSM 1968]ODV62142.1 hypothetical protein ASCRUDRAFT_132232 [Ascoidea rubescens DSM 1968]